MSMLIAGSIASTLGHTEISLETHHSFRGQDSSLNVLHTKIYRELIQAMEKLLASQNIRIVRFQGEIRRKSNGIFELIYMVNTRPLQS